MALLLKSALLAAPLLAATATLFQVQVGETTLVVSGTVEARQSRVGSLVGGRISSVRVEEGQLVHPGEVLFVLDRPALMQQAATASARIEQILCELARLEQGSRPEEIAIHRAIVKQARAHVRLLKNGFRKEEVEIAKLDLMAAKSQFEYKKKSVGRLEQLLPSRAVSQDELDAAYSELRVSTASYLKCRKNYGRLRKGNREESIQEAEAQLEQAKQKLALLVAGSSNKELAAMRAEVRVSQAKLAEIETQIEELTVRSPIEGFVQSLDLHVGDLVTAGTPLAVVVDANQWWIECYLPVSASLQLGDEVFVSSLCANQSSASSEIAYIASEAEFMPDNLQTTEARDRQVVMVKLRVQGLQQTSRPGMLVEVTCSQPESTVPQLLVVAN